MYRGVGVLLASVFVISGCTHNIQMNPNLDEIRSVEIQRTIDKNVGYFISQSDKAKSVATPGGGGDKVGYKPYADSEAALNTVLSKIYAKVYSVPSLDDQEYLKSKNISYIFTPEIVTDSSSSSAFTWPPTDFSVELTCTAVDPAGKTIWSKKVVGEGVAQFSEFKSDFSLSARRATADAFKKLMQEISSAEEL